MTSITYKGKDIEEMEKEELKSCIKALYQKLKDKHHIIEGMKLANGNGFNYQDSLNEFMDLLRKKK